MKGARCLVKGAVALVLAGCTLAERTAQNARDAVGADDAMRRQRENFRQSTEGVDARRDAQRVNKPWLVGRAVPLSRDALLPPALRANVDTTLMFGAGKVGLTVIAERITHATGIPVRVRPDALLPGEHFLPRLALASQANSVAMPDKATFGRGPQPLPRALDALARTLGISWRFQDGAIEFFRTETRVFDIRALTLSAQADARLGRSASNKAGGFDNTSRTSLSMTEQQVMDSIRVRIEPLLTRAGVVVAQPGAVTSVVVTDIPDALDAVARLLERENRALTRRVRLVFEEITLARHENLELGVDWDIAVRGGAVAAALSTPALAASTGAASAATEFGQASLGVSKLVLQALSRYGTVLRHTTVPVLTLNRRPVTHAVRTTFSYIDRVQTSAPSVSVTPGIASAASVSVSEKEETVGAILTLVPDAQEDGQILLSVAYDNTVAQPIKTVTFGDQSQRAQVQQITIDGNGTVQQVALKAGQPMLISGFERREQDSTHARLAPDAPMLLGGHDRTGHTSSATPIIVTAQVEEGF